MAAIMQVRQLSAGQGVGYNSTFVAGGPMRVGVVALGYADGYLRSWSARGAMVHLGRRLPVLGRVSMDMTVIDLAAAPELAEGDWVEVDYALPEAAAASRNMNCSLCWGNASQDSIVSNWDLLRSKGVLRCRCCTC
jgi:alanine racemase